MEQGSIEKPKSALEKRKRRAIESEPERHGPGVAAALRLSKIECVVPAASH